MAEWGYISFKELRDLSVGGIEIDCEFEEYFPIQKALEVKKICRGNGWERDKDQYSWDPHSSLSNSAYR